MVKSNKDPEYQMWHEEFKKGYKLREEEKLDKVK